MTGQLIQSLVDALSAGATLGLAALSIGLVFGVIRLANFAQAEIITASAYCLIFTWELGWFIAVPLSIIVAVAMSLLMEFAVFSRMRSANPATLLIASFGLSFLLQRVYELMFSNNVRTAPVASGLAQTVEFAGVRVQLLSVATIVIAGLLLLGLHLFLTRTSMGLQLKAAAADFRTARLVGIPGSLAGGFLVGFVTSLLATWLPQEMSNFKDAYVFVLVIGVLLFRPSGLLIKGRGVART